MEQLGAELRASPVEDLQDELKRINFASPSCPHAIVSSVTMKTLRYVGRGQILF